MPTILAHELGHFMGHVLRDKEHTLTSLMSPEVNWRKSVGIWDKESEKEWIRTVQIPTEVQAWKYADMIYPNVKQDVRALALLSYEGYGGATND